MLNNIDYLLPALTLSQRCRPALAVDSFAWLLVPDVFTVTLSDVNVAIAILLISHAMGMHQVVAGAAASLTIRSRQRQHRSLPHDATAPLLSYHIPHHISRFFCPIPRSSLLDVRVMFIVSLWLVHVAKAAALCCSRSFNSSSCVCAVPLPIHAPPHAAVPQS